MLHFNVLKCAHYIPRLLHTGLFAWSSCFQLLLELFSPINFASNPVDNRNGPTDKTEAMEPDEATAVTNTSQTERAIIFERKLNLSRMQLQLLLHNGQLFQTAHINKCFMRNTPLKIFTPWTSSGGGRVFIGIGGINVDVRTLKWGVFVEFSVQCYCTLRVIHMQILACFNNWKVNRLNRVICRWSSVTPSNLCVGWCGTSWTLDVRTQPRDRTVFPMYF